jgi:hypothetical protein
MKGAFTQRNFMEEVIRFLVLVAVVLQLAAILKVL